MHGMQAPRLAEAYCDRLYERRAAALAAPSGAAGKGRALQPAWSRRDLQPGQDIYLALVEVRQWLRDPCPGAQLLPAIGHSTARSDVAHTLRGRK